MYHHMRLSEMKYRLETYLPQLQVEAKPLQGSSQVVTVKRTDTLRFAASMLDSVDALRSDLGDVKRHPVFHLAENSTVEQALVQEFAKTTAKVIGHGNSILEALCQVAPKPMPNEISVKLPAIQTFQELQAFVGDLRLALDDHTRRVFGDGLKLQAFDTGTEWLVFVAASVPIYRYVCDFLSRALKLREQQLQVRALQAALETRKEFQETIVGMMKAQEQVAKAYAQELVSGLIDANLTENPDARNDALNSAMRGMESLMHLVNQGTEIHRSLNAPEEIRKLLPEPVTNKASEIKLLPPSAESSSPAKPEPPAK